MKYLRIDKTNSNTVSLNCNYIVVFPDTVTHKEMASHFDENSVVSAGFVMIDLDDINNSFCYGESISLHLRSLGKEDTDLFKINFVNMFVPF